MNEEALEEEVPADAVLDSSPESIETETPQVEETAEAVATTETTPATGQPRLPDGTFAKKTAAEVAAEGQEGVAEAAPREAPQVSQPGTPVQLKADGQLYDFPGATRRSDGVVELDAAGFDLMHRYVGKALTGERKIAQLQQQVAQAAQQTTAEAEYVKLLGERYAELAMLDDESLVEALQVFRSQYPALKAQAEADHYKRMLEQQTNASKRDPREVQQEQEAAFATSFNETFQEALQQPWAKALAPEDQAQLKQELSDIADSFLVVADRDDPQNDVVRGEWLFNAPKMLQAIQRRAKYVADLRQSTVRTAGAAQRNDAKQPAKVVAPPMGAAKTVTTSVPSTPARVKSREEWWQQNLGSSTR